MLWVYESGYVSGFLRIRLYIVQAIDTTLFDTTLHGLWLANVKEKYHSNINCNTRARVVLIFLYISSRALRGSCKKFCHWVRITSVLRFVKYIFITNLQSIPPLTETHFSNLFTQSRKADK